MSNQTKNWEQQVRDAAARGEEELHRVIAFINDEVVPEVRRNGSVALRRAAQELDKLAQRMEDRQSGKDAPKP
jgi:histidinol dehydrogenase